MRDCVKWVGSSSVYIWCPSKLLDCEVLPCVLRHRFAFSAVNECQIWFSSHRWSICIQMLRVFVKPYLFHLVSDYLFLVGFQLPEETVALRLWLRYLERSSGLLLKLNGVNFVILWGYLLTVCSVVKPVFELELRRSSHFDRVLYCLCARELFGEQILLKSNVVSWDRPNRFFSLLVFNIL